MKDTELAWAAGFFDGEGCSFGLARSTKRRGKGRLTLVVSQSGDTILLERFRQAVGGLGHIDRAIKMTIPYKKQPYRWRIADRSDICFIMQHLWPYLGPIKRDQFLAAMEKVKNGK